jgi:hypothetical protein
LLESLPEEFRANDVKELKLSEDLPTGRVLGLSWDLEEDVFIWKYNYNKVPSGFLTGEKIPTKREILGLVMSCHVMKLLEMGLLATSVSGVDGLMVRLSLSWRR